MPINEQGVFLISTPPEWAAFRSPTAVELVELLASLGSATVPQLAAQVGRRATGLYHHIRRFEEIGLVRRLDGTSAGANGVVYELIAKRFMPDFDPVTGRNLDRFKQVYRSLFRKGQRTFEESVDAGLVSIHGQTIAWNIYLDFAWLTDDEVKRVHDHLAAIDGIYDNARGRRSGTPWSILVASVPTRRRPDPDHDPTDPTDGRAGRALGGEPES